MKKPVVKNWRGDKTVLVVDKNEKRVIGMIKNRREPKPDALQSKSGRVNKRVGRIRPAKPVK